MVSEALRTFLIDNGYGQKTWLPSAVNLWKDATEKALEDGSLDGAKLAELQAKSSSAKEFLNGDARVKRASERYSTTKSVGVHTKFGKSVMGFSGKPVETLSEVEMAKCGAFVKRLMQRSGVNCTLTDHDQSLLNEAYERDEWVGDINGEHRRGINGMACKALIDDSNSGGSYVNPSYFDEALNLTPELNGELLPRVTIQPVSRGSSAETATVGTPSLTWGTVEGTPQSVFDCTDLINGVETAFRPVSVHIEVGKDLASDSPIAIAQVLIQQGGERLMYELDRVIAVGNGTTEPEGVFTASGTTDIGNPAGGSGAPPQVNDYEALMFGLPKQYRTAVNRCCFLGNDVSYRRARGIPVGGADARRVFGMDESSYMLLDHPYAIQNSISNSRCAFLAFSKYKMYRRAGSEVKVTTEGKTLTLANTMLLTIRARYGGVLTDKNALVYCDSLQA